MIPFYAVGVTGGKVYSVDDQAVVTDLAALDGTGGQVYQPFLLSELLPIANNLGMSKVRRIIQRIGVHGNCTIMLTPWKDGSDTGQNVVRSFAPADVGIMNGPFAYQASDFQIKVTVTAFDSEVQLGNAEVWMVPKRRSR